VILALVVSTLLLLLAVGLRRDQVRREVALSELRELAEKLDGWANMERSLPIRLEIVFPKTAAKVDRRFEYVDKKRRDLALSGSMPVAVVVGREPLELTFSSPGRAVLLCRQLDFQVKWFTDDELAQQRGKEDKKLKQDQRIQRTKARS
jgi:hypothetical protein